MASKFTISKAKNGKFHFNLKSGNGEIVLASQGYKSRSGCKNGIESVRTNGAIADRFEEKQAKNGKAYFVLKAGNGQVVGQSQMYSDARSCRAGISSVKKSAKSAKLVDETSS